MMNDSCFRRKAAVLKSLDWGVVDFTIYNETLSGHGKAIPRCHYCLSEYHHSHECSLAPDSKPDARDTSRPPRATHPVCQLYNRKMETAVILRLANSCMSVWHAEVTTQQLTAEGSGGSKSRQDPDHPSL